MKYLKLGLFTGAAVLVVIIAKIGFNIPPSDNSAAVIGSVNKTVSTTDIKIKTPLDNSLITNTSIAQKIAPVVNTVKTITPAVLKPADTSLITKTSITKTINAKAVTKPVKEIYFDLAIPDFSTTKEGQEYIKVHGASYPKDAWGRPIQKNIYQEFNKKVLAPRKVSFLKRIINFFSPSKALASFAYGDVDPNSLNLSVLNCRSGTSVQGYFKAYFEEVAVQNGHGYDDPTYGQARRDEVCHVLQEVASLLKLNNTNVTPDILFAVDPGNIPANALAAASSYFGYYSVGEDNGSLHKHIITQIDPTPGNGNFDAFVYTKFGGVNQWDVDSTLNTNTYSFHTVITHEIIHALGFRGVLPAVIGITNVPMQHGTFDDNTHSVSPATNTNDFFTQGISNLLNVPIGAPSPWFINNTDIYRGIKNIIGASPDGARPVFSPSSWQQGSSLSHFDETRAPANTTYVMNPSISTNTSKLIHNDEKEVLCHLGYRVNNMTGTNASGCGLPTPVAVNDNMTISGTSMCVSPLANDVSFSGGTLSLNSVSFVAPQLNDQLTYWTSSTCTTGQLSGPTNASYIKISFGSSLLPRSIEYTNKDSISHRISFPANISLNPVLSCQDTYNYVSQFGTQGSGNGQFAPPFNLALDSYGNLYVSDIANHRIQKFTSNGTYITQWGNTGTGPGQFGSGDPEIYMAIDSSDNVYVVDIGNYRVQKFNSNGTYISEWGSYGAGPGQFFGPTGITIDSIGNIYIADGSNNRIQKFNSNGTYISEWGSYGAGNGQFWWPLGLAHDSANNIYVADEGNSRIQKFNSNGTYITQWGNPGVGPGHFNTPYSVAIDSSDNVYVPDAGSNRIQKFTSNGTYITQWGNTGHGNGEFNTIYTITADVSSNIYVVDAGNYRIQKFTNSCPLPLPSSNSISGTVYYDQNSDHIKDNNESGLSGIQVGLFNSAIATTPIQTVTTNSNMPNVGMYTFTNLPNGIYYIAVMPENIYSSVTQPATNTLLTGYSHAYNVSTNGGQNVTGEDFGVVLQCTTSLKVLSPNGGEVFTVGQLATVTWVGCNTPATDNVKISLSLNGQVVSQQLLSPTLGANPLPNTGSAIVKILDPLTVSSWGANAVYGLHYKILVQDVTLASAGNYSVWDKSDNLITVNP